MNQSASHGFIIILGLEFDIGSFEVIILSFKSKTVKSQERNSPYSLLISQYLVLTSCS